MLTYNSEMGSSNCNKRTHIIAELGCLFWGPDFTGAALGRGS
jgi:hypothetical protein